MSSVAVDYRNYQLPWTPSEVDERRYRRIMALVIGLFIAFGIVIPLLPTPPKPAVVEQPVPERIVEFILEQKKPPEAEPPKPVEEPKVETPVQEPRPARVVPKPDPRKKAEKTMAALTRDLAALRDMDVKDVSDAPLNAATGAKADVSRNILTAQVGSGSGGIATSSVSSGFGGAATGLKGNATARVASPVPVDAREATRSGTGKQASRSREEIELVFDKNKSAIYALYSRALRDNPSLQGKVVLEVTIAPTGDVTACRIVSSELNDAELERKLVARVKLFKFPARDVATMTTTKPIEFFPA